MIRILVNPQGQCRTFNVVQPGQYGNSLSTVYRFARSWQKQVQIPDRPVTLKRVKRQGLGITVETAKISGAGLHYQWFASVFRYRKHMDRRIRQDLARLGIHKGIGRISGVQAQLNPINSQPIGSSHQNLDILTAGDVAAIRWRYQRQLRRSLIGQQLVRSREVQELGISADTIGHPQRHRHGVRIAIQRQVGQARLTIGKIHLPGVGIERRILPAALGDLNSRLADQFQVALQVECQCAVIQLFNRVWRDDKTRLRQID